jgi:hypothetical protein
MLRDRRDAVRVALSDDEPEEPTTPRRRADRTTTVIVDPCRDEPFHHPVGCGDAECGISCVDEITDAIDDELENIVDRPDARDRT